MPRWVKVLLAALASLVVLAVLLYGFRNVIATAGLAYAVNHREGVSCTHPKVEIESAFDWVEIAPIECKLSQGRIQRAETFTPARIILDGLSVARVHVTRATLDFRDRDLSNVETNTLGDLARVTGATDPLLKGVLDAADMYQPDSPPVAVDQLTMLRAGKKESVMHDFTKSVEGEFDRSHAASVDMGIEGLASVRNFDMRVTPARGKLAVGVYFGDAKRGEEPDAELRAEGHGLNTAKPKFDLSLDTDESHRERKTREVDDARAARSAPKHAMER